MLVYVLNKYGNPLMPCKPQRARKLLRQGKAEVVNRTPFTIQSKYGSSGYVQPITLGVDPGFKNVGLSAITERRELFRVIVEVRTDVSQLLSERRVYRRARRSRKTRYRKPRFLNRGRKGWFTPSIRHKIETHVKLVEWVRKILPITSLKIETAQFDSQKLKNLNISGEEYQNGPQKGFWNTREYVLWRDGHICQNCKGKSKDRGLVVHHIESRKTGGDRPDNLITLCKTCHNKLHKGEIKLKVEEPKSDFKALQHLNMIRQQIYNRLKEKLPTTSTFGYLTEQKRIEQGLTKTHDNDAYIIADGNGQKRETTRHIMRQVRKQNRKLYRGKRSRIRNTAPKRVFGFQRYDKVRYEGQEAFIMGRRISGYFDLKKINGTKVSASANYKKLKLLETAKPFMIEQTSIPLPLEGRGLLEVN